jgi:4-hydroxy-tetrahydrodipicolinate synthase
MIYNSFWNSVNLSLELIERLSALRNVVALKWAAPSSDQFTAGLHRFRDRLAILANSGLIVWAHMMGAVGFITHIGNFWPEETLDLWRLLEGRQYEKAIEKMTTFEWRWGDWVRKVMQETEGEGPFIKAAMEQVGLKVGPPRPPARAVSRQLRDELSRLFAEVVVPGAQT